MSGPSQLFNWYDYILFVVMVALSISMGFFFACFGSRQSTVDEYVLGGRNMKVFPIAASLLASTVSSFTLLAVPADVYRYGSAFAMGAVSNVIAGAIAIYIYLPVLFDLKITSTAEYIGKRFDEKTRLLVSLLNIMGHIFYAAVVAYLPAIALSSGTGLSINVITPLICAICVFYTTIGGLKTVVWTDVLQSFFMVAAVAVILIAGASSAGGWRIIWKKSLDSGRLNIFDFDLDPTKRDSFWMLVIGYTVHLLPLYGVSQNYVQKFLAVSTFRETVWSMIYFCLSMGTFKLCTVLMGLIFYAEYSGCDPLANKQIQRSDQLLPFYILDKLANVPGLSGLFIAAIFSACFSTLSAFLNSAATTIYIDIFQKFYKPDTFKSKVLKWIVFGLGVFTASLVLVIERIQGLLPFFTGVVSLILGPSLGVFTLGLLFTTSNATGAFYGGITGIICLGSIAFPAQYYQMKGVWNYASKPLSTNSCDYIWSFDTNGTTYWLKSNSTLNTPLQPLFIFRISYYYYALIGFLATVVSGVIISHLTRKDGATVDEKLLSPIRRKLNKYKTIKKALNLTEMNSCE